MENTRPPVPTGFDVLDDLIGGLHPDELTVIAARPAMDGDLVPDGISFIPGIGYVDDIILVVHAGGARLQGIVPGDHLAEQRDRALPCLVQGEENVCSSIHATTSTNLRR